MRDRARISRLSLGLLPLLLFACGGDDAPAPAPDPIPAAEAPAPPAAMEHVSIALQEMNDSGVSGEAMGMQTEDSVVVVLELTGLPGEGEYSAHIHLGSCQDPGAPVVTLNPVIGLADGTGASTTTVDAEEVPADAPHFIMVHGEGGAPIVCGDMEGHAD